MIIREYLIIIILIIFLKICFLNIIICPANVKILTNKKKFNQIFIVKKNKKKFVYQTEKKLNTIHAIHNLNISKNMNMNNNKIKKIWNLIVLKEEKKIKIKKKKIHTNKNQLISLEENVLLIKVAKSFLGIPYELGGNSIRGIDCSAFVKKIYFMFNKIIPRTAKEQSIKGKIIILKQDLQEGDLVFFRTHHQDHVGIYLGNNQFIHLSYVNNKARIDNILNEYFISKFLKGIRIKE